MSSELIGRPKLIVRAVKIVDLLAHRRRHRAMRTAIAAPIFAAIRALQLQLGLKYLNPQHLAIGLTSDARAAAMIHHYDFLAARVPATSFAAIVGRGLCVWSHAGDTGHHRIDLAFSHPTDNEGELTLDYRFDGVVVSACSFTFANGALAGVPDATILAVTRIQGVRAAAAAMRTAMRGLHSVSPAMVFTAVLSGIAARFGVATLAGVAASAQVSRLAVGARVCPTVYDEFFERIGGVRATPLFYRIALPLVEKPIGEVKSGNRSRTRAQRALRAEIATSAASAFDA